MTARGAAGGEWNPAGVVARLAALIDERDAGDPCRAASRLGVPEEALRHLSAALADDSREDRPGAAGVLAAAAHAYEVDATWLVTGQENFHGEELPPASRIRVADLLLRVGHHLLAGRRRGGRSPDRAPGGEHDGARDGARDGVRNAARDGARSGVAAIIPERDAAG